MRTKFRQILERFENEAASLCITSITGMVNLGILLEIASEYNREELTEGF